MTFKLTAKQEEALGILAKGPNHFLLEGGTRSAKTFLHCRTIATRAIVAPSSRHAILRFRFSHVKGSVVYDTWPKMMRMCFPGVPYELDKTDWFARLPNESEVWFGGLDDKERTEKILGKEYATILLNEVSQIPWTSRNIAVTRLAQRCPYVLNGVKKYLRLLMLYDCNPPPKSHWIYRLFHLKQDPDSKQALTDAHLYASLRMNPVDNRDNLSPEYLAELDRLPARMRLRFRDGLYADANENAMWTSEIIEKWRESDVPDLLRIGVAVDPSGASDDENEGNDEIGIMVGGLGVDGNAYLLEDLTIKAGPEKWGAVAVSGYDRHDADVVVGETNFGGDMVRFVVHAAAAADRERKGKPKPTFKKITASRGKAVRAAPIAVLHEQGKVRFAGNFPKLEDELCGFTTTGYMGSGSPNRADAFVWLMSELFPGVMKKAAEEDKPQVQRREPVVLERQGDNQGWMR